MPTPTPARAVPATVLLLVVLVAVNGVAVWGIFSARQSAEREALADLGLTTAARARALEAALASLAGDLIFLSQSPALVEAPSGMASEDPMVARWARVGAEGGLLLFLESHDGSLWFRSRAMVHERTECLDSVVHGLPHVRSTTADRSPPS